jgi:altronate dehydratase large subunit
MRFWGYRRSDGSVGVRNHVLIFPTNASACTVAEKISRELPDTVCVTHPHGFGHLGEEKEHMIRAMSGFCANPNVAGVLLVGFNGAQLTPALFAEPLIESGRSVQTISIRSSGGTSRAVTRGRELAEKLLQDAATAKRELVDISGLVVGTQCGGSDTLSGLTANPSVGVACDLLVDEGGTVILSEVAEMLGAEHILARRAATDDVADAIWKITEAKEASIKSMGLDVRGTEPGPGNIAGGLTTLEEKSLGAIRKGGTSAIAEVVKYAQKPSQRGLIIMDGPAHDVVSNTGMVACGAQIIVYTTGTGVSLGTPIAPTIKVSTNSSVYAAMRDNIDLNAGAILDGEESIRSVGERVFREIVDVASGKLTRAEVLGHVEFAIHNIGPVI